MTDRFDPEKVAGVGDMLGARLVHDADEDLLRTIRMAARAHAKHKGPQPSRSSGLWFAAGRAVPPSSLERN